MLIAITDTLRISPNASLEMIQAIEAKLHEPDGDSRAKIDAFMRGQFREAQKLQGPNPARPNFVPHDTTEPGGLFRKLESVPIILGLVGMYGCTSILIMSKHAVWWSHFWGNPWFVTNDAGTIRNTFLDRSILTDKIHLGQDVPRPFSANVLATRIVKTKSPDCYVKLKLESRLPPTQEPVLSPLRHVTAKATYFTTCTLRRYKGNWRWCCLVSSLEIFRL
jgi:hypothetical protein